MADPGSSRRGGWTAPGIAVARTLGVMLALSAASTSPASALGTFTRHLTITVGTGVGAPVVSWFMGWSVPYPCVVWPGTT